MLFAAWVWIAGISRIGTRASLRSARMIGVTIATGPMIRMISITIVLQRTVGWFQPPIRRFVRFFLVLSKGDLKLIW